MMTMRRLTVSLFAFLLLLRFRAFECFVHTKARRDPQTRTKYVCLQWVPDSPAFTTVPSISWGAAFDGSGDSLVRAIQLGGIPAAGMLLVTGVGLQVQTPQNVVGALQHFAAGILLTTVAKELLPEMVQATGFAQNLASAFGFFAGVGVLILLGILLPEEHVPTKQTDFPTPPTRPTPSLRNRRISKKREAFMSMSFPAESITNLEMDAVRDELRSGWENIDPGVCSPESYEQPKFSNLTLPTALLAAVCIDSALDGLLVGTSTALDPSTSNILSASLTVESSFLGLTIATAIRTCPAPAKIKLLGTTLAPASLVLGSSIGGSLAPTMAEYPALLAGLLGFGTSATLFMVAEELLLQAHEDGAEHVWWVDLQLYIGFYASVMLDKALDMA